MHHDENDPRHPRHRDLHQRREQHPEDFRREQNFNDFKSRWGEPSPPLNLNQNEWQPRGVGRFEQEGQSHHREEWLPNERRPYQSPRGEQQHRDTSWRQRDINFDRNNQRAEDRWMQDRPITDPDNQRRRRRGLPDHDGHWEERNRYRDEDDRNRQ